MDDVQVAALASMAVPAFRVAVAMRFYLLLEKILLEKSMPWFRRRLVIVTLTG